MRARTHPFPAFALVLCMSRLGHADTKSVAADPVATKPVATAQTLDPGPPWGVSLGAGLAAGAFLESSLSRQLANAGFAAKGPGFFLHMPLEIDRRVFSGLALGLALDMQFGSISSERNEMAQGFHTLNALFLVRPSFQALDRGKTDGVLVGLDLGAGGGTALWVVRGEVEAAPSYRLRTNIVVSFVRRGFGVGFRIGAQYAGAGPFGPLRLHMNDWSSFLEPRVEYRW